MSRQPVYEDILKLARERPGSLFLDVGCCTGGDVKRLVADGWPAGQAICTDIQAGAQFVCSSDLSPLTNSTEFWDVGHRTFKSTPATCLIKFIVGDVLDDAFLTPAPVSTAPLDVAGLTSLTSLHGRLSVIFIYAVFHAFDGAQQAQLAQRLASLLSPEPSSARNPARLRQARAGTSGRAGRCSSCSATAPRAERACEKAYLGQMRWRRGGGAGGG